MIYGDDLPDVDAIVAYEDGTLDEEGVLQLFASMIRSGAVWQLQGSYGRTAMALIKNDVISTDGRILAPRLVELDRD